MKSRFLFALSVLTIATAAAATTWTVEKDGSGDFAVIQDAVDVAASGDTIRIGPGRYDDKRLVSCPGWTDYVRVLVTQQELTLIGTGDETIIGQEELWDLSQGWHKGIVAGAYFGAGNVKISHIMLQNMAYGIDLSEVYAQVDSCSFEHNHFSMTSIDGYTLNIEGCRFEDVERDGLHVAVINQYEVAISDCSFTLWDYHTWPQSHVHMSNVQEGTARRCEFREGAGGIQASTNTVLTITDSIFDGQRHNGVAAAPGGSIVLERSHFRNVRYAVHLWGGDAQITARNCVVERVEDCSVKIEYVESASFQNCDLARGSLGTVWVDDCDLSQPQHLDFTNNYWGTDDPDSIQSWIHDRNDSDAICRYVDFEPFRSESTPVRSVSLSELKALMWGGQR